MIITVLTLSWVIASFGELACDLEYKKVFPCALLIVGTIGLTVLILGRL